MGAPNYGRRRLYEMAAAGFASQLAYIYMYIYVYNMYIYICIYIYIYIYIYITVWTIFWF